MKRKKQLLKILLMAGGAALSVYIYRSLSDKQKKRFLKSMKLGVAEFIGYVIPYLQENRKLAADLPAAEQYAAAP